MEATRAFNLGVSYLDSGEIEMAVLAFGQAIRLDPSLASAYNGRAVALALIDRLSEAMADCGEAIRLAPAEPDHRRTRGYIYERLGETAKSHADLTEADRLERFR